jgi:chitin disaccharide deacetylase
MNPVLIDLGYQPGDRVVVVHADDVGMCQSSLEAFVDLLQIGLVSSCSVMVPCPWFQATANYCQRNSEVDMGVHITLTSEWEGYRWGPVSRGDQANQLLDEQGYFARDQKRVWEQADSDVVLSETQQQLELAVSAGICPTHTEDHMAALAHPRFLRAYIDLALERGLPVRALRPKMFDPGAGPWQKAHYEALSHAELRGMPLFDNHTGVNLVSDCDPIESVRSLFRSLPEGELSAVVLHPAKDTPELRAITPDWQQRAAEYQVFCNPSLAEEIRRMGIYIIGFRPLQEYLRKRTSEES